MLCRHTGGHKVVGGGEGEVGTKPSYVAALQFAASIDVSPFMKMHQDAVFSHRFCLSMVAGPWHQHIKDPHGNNLITFSAGRRGMPYQRIQTLW